MPGMSTDEIRIRPMHRTDWPAVAAIYAEGIASGNATFDTSVPDWSAWDEAHLPTCRLVAHEGERVVGWAALSAASRRAVYAGVAELSVYVAAGARGRGVGRALLAALIDASENAGIWTLQAGIFPENEASLAVHRSLGFRDVGRRVRIGRDGDRWRDVLLLERRSERVGVQHPSG